MTKTDQDIKFNNEDVYTQTNNNNKNKSLKELKYYLLL